MSAHNHPEFVDGCFRCGLSHEEAREYEESTPTTEEVEEMFVDLPPGQIEGSVESRRFRRWHSAEIAAAEKRGAVRALREAHVAFGEAGMASETLYVALLDRADRIEEGQ